MKTFSTFCAAGCKFYLQLSSRLQVRLVAFCTVSRSCS